MTGVITDWIIFCDAISVTHGEKQYWPYFDTLCYIPSSRAKFGMISP